MTWLDSYFYKPNFYQKCLAFALLPASFLYLIIALLNTKFKKQIDFKMPIISVGNLSFSGNGKTPFCKALSAYFYKNYAPIFIVLRGYKRQSKGLVVVKEGQKVLCDVQSSGDEAMEYALQPSISGVIVSEDRTKGILKAKELGARLILLDDAFSKFYIKKLDILLESAQKPYFNFVLPSGAYRLPKSFEKKADIVAREGEDFTRKSFVKECSSALLITAIAKPFRLSEHFKKARACHFFKDHHAFSKSELEALLKKYDCDTLMLTFKDYVKVKDMGFKCELIELKLTLTQALLDKIEIYLKGFKP